MTAADVSATIGVIVAQRAERVAWSHDGTLLACAAGKVVRVWNRDGTLAQEYGGHRATVTDIQWHPSERLLCSTSYGGVTLLDPALVGATQIGQSVSHVLWSKDGRSLLLGGARGEVRLLDGSGM